VSKSHLQIRIATLLLVVAALASCNGQAKTDPSKRIDSESKTSATGPPRIRKTQRTDQYDNIHCGLQDRNGNLWFGTTGAGVYRYDGSSFVNFTASDGLSNDYVWCVSEDRSGHLWFGTADGVCRYDGVTFTDIPIPGIKGGEFSKDHFGNPSEETAVWSIMQDKSGGFWFGTTDGVYRYDGTTFTHFTRDDGIVNNTGTSINKVESVLEDGAGNIWFGGRSTEGIFCFDGKSLNSIKPDGKNWLWPIMEDRAGNIWFSTRNRSVYRYNGKDFSSFGETELTDWASSIVEDRDGNIWFGTRVGLAKFDGRHITILTTKDGLGNDDVFSVTLDRSGNLWVGTRDMGLYRFDGKTFTSFSE
jgi:ligand-binding sensor domain-containing protein